VYPPESGRSEDFRFRACLAAAVGTLDEVPRLLAREWADSLSVGRKSSMNGSSTGRSLSGTPRGRTARNRLSGSADPKSRWREMHHRACGLAPARRHATHAEPTRRLARLASRARTVERPELQHSASKLWEGLTLTFTTCDGELELVANANLVLSGPATP